MQHPRRRALEAGGRLLQILGVLGTSQLLAVVARRTPGWATSRLAEAFAAPAEGQDAADLLVRIARDSIGVATLEELIFRGILFEGLRRSLGLGAAISGSAMLFGLVHADLHQGLAATLLGLQLGALRACFGLPLAIVAHATNNLAALLTTRADIEPTLLTLTLAALLSSSACAALVCRLRRPEPPDS